MTLSCPVPSSPRKSNNNPPELQSGNGVFKEDGPNNKERDGFKMAKDLVSDRRGLSNDGEDGEVDDNAQNPRCNHKNDFVGGQTPHKKGRHVVHVRSGDN